MDTNKKTNKISKARRLRYWLLYKLRLISGHKYAEKLVRWGLPCPAEIEKRGAKIGLGERLRYIWEYPVRLQEECDCLEFEVKELEKAYGKGK